MTERTVSDICGESPIIGVTVDALGVGRGVWGIWTVTVCEMWFGQVKSGMKQRSSDENPIISWE